MRRFIKQLLCRHLWTRVRNSHGDEINTLGGRRTLLECDLCGKTYWDRDYITRGMAIKNKDDEPARTNGHDQHQEGAKQ